jgi:hypothetical protein
MKTAQTKEVISILLVVDVVGALSSGALDGNIYLFDSNRRNGSTGEGTQELTTKLHAAKGEVAVLWNIISLDPEAFVSISNIQTDSKYMDAVSHTYEGSDVEYWTGTVKKDFRSLCCRFFIKLGSCDTEFTWEMKFAGSGAPDVKSA